MVLPDFAKAIPYVVATGIIDLPDNLPTNVQARIVDQNGQTIDMGTLYKDGRLLAIFPDSLQDVKIVIEEKPNSSRKRPASFVPLELPIVRPDSTRSLGKNLSQSHSMVIELAPAKINDVERMKKTGQPFVLNHSYASDQSSFAPSSALQDELSFFAQWLIHEADLRLIIFGHTDDVGTEEYNIDLSAQRAQEVRDYLVGLGVKEEQLTIEAVGSAEPLSDNESEVGKSSNRRIEVAFRKQ